MAFVGLIIAAALILGIGLYAALVSWRIHRATGLKCCRYLAIAKASAGVLFAWLCGVTALAVLGYDGVPGITLKLIVTLEIVASGAVTAALCYGLFAECEQLTKVYRRVRADKRAGWLHLLWGRLPTPIELSSRPTSVTGGWAIAAAVLALLFAGASFWALFADLYPDRLEFYVLNASKVAYGAIVAGLAFRAIRNNGERTSVNEKARRAS